MFGVGLGAPRWAQMLWGTSGIGLYLPWLGGSAVASALASRALWLWRSGSWTPSRALV